MEATSAAEHKMGAAGSEGQQRRRGGRLWGRNRERVGLCVGKIWFRQKRSRSWEPKIGGNRSSLVMDFLPLSWSNLPKDKLQLTRGSGDRLPAQCCGCSFPMAPNCTPPSMPLPPCLSSEAFGFFCVCVVASQCH